MFDQCANLAIPYTDAPRLVTLLKPLSYWTHIEPERDSLYFSKLGIRCLFVTLRDPVERLQAAFEYEHANYNKEKSYHMFSFYRQTFSLKSFIDSVRNEAHTEHNKTMAMWLNSKNPVWKNGYLTNGNLGMVPQVWYLKKNNAISYNMLCSDRLLSDWERITHLKSNMQYNISKHISKRIRLNERDAKYVRDVMFPEDTQLITKYCAGR